MREEAGICKLAGSLRAQQPGGGNQEGSQLHWPRDAGRVPRGIGQGVANREGHEGQRVLGCGEKVGV